MGGLRERSLWDALSGLWVRFLRLDVWEVPLWKQCGSVWRLLVRAPRLLTVLPVTREGHRDSPLLVPCCSVGVPLCHFSQQASWGSASPSPSTHLMVPLRTRQPPGSGPCSVLSSPELWRSPCGLGPSPPLRPWLSPHHCAHRGGCGAEAGLVSREEPQHKQARVPCPYPGPAPTCGGPDRPGGGAIPAGSWIRDPSRSRSPHHESDCHTEPQIALGNCSCLPTFPCGRDPGRKADSTLIVHRSLPTHCVTHPVCCSLPSRGSGMSEAESR